MVPIKSEVGSTGPSFVLFQSNIASSVVVVSRREKSRLVSDSVCFVAFIHISDT